MTVLYNAKRAGDAYRVTKFVDDEPEGSYITTLTTCDCPAGIRPVCRHRQMLPKFMEREAIDTGWFFDFDRGGWVDYRTEDEALPPLPAGVQAFSLDDPSVVHNAIAEAVGEPEAILQPHSTMVSAAAFDAADVGSNPAGVATFPHELTDEAEHIYQEVIAPSRKKPNDGRRV